MQKVKPKSVILLNKNGESINRWEVFIAPSNVVMDKNSIIQQTIFGKIE